MSACFLAGRGGFHRQSNPFPASRGQREQPLMIRSTLSSPMMTTGVVPAPVVSGFGVRLEVMAVVERELFDDASDDVVG